MLGAQPWQDGDVARTMAASEVSFITARRDLTGIDRVVAIGSP